MVIMSSSKLIGGVLFDLKFNSPAHGGYAYNILEAKVRVGNKIYMVTFYRHPNNYDDWGSEIYSGKNYIVGSTDNSYSRIYQQWKGLPEKWRWITSQLNKIHNSRRKQFD